MPLNNFQHHAEFSIKILVMVNTPDISQYKPGGKTIIDITLSLRTTAAGLGSEINLDNKKTSPSNLLEMN